MGGNYLIYLPYVTVTIGMRVLATDLLTNVLKDVKTELKLLEVPNKIKLSGTSDCQPENEQQMTNVFFAVFSMDFFT